MEKFPSRQEVIAQDESLTWDLTRLYPDRQVFQEAMGKTKKALERLTKEYLEKIEGEKDPEILHSIVEKMEEALAEMIRLFTYVDLAFVTDMTDQDMAKFAGTSRLELDEIDTLFANLQTRLPRVDSAVLEAAGKAHPAYQHFYKRLIDEKAHLLSPETEGVLSELSSSLNAWIDLYQTLKSNDTHFADFEADGKTYPLSYVLYENVYCTDPSPAVRRNSFKAFSEGLAKVENTVAAIYNQHVQTDVKMAKIRHYDDVFDYLLDRQQVSKDLYNRQIDVIMKDFAPVMRKYSRLLKKVLGLDTMYFSDLKALLDPSYSPKVTPEEAATYIDKMTKRLGPDYHDMIMNFQKERWIDFPQNVGKSTGGFCTTVPGAGPYILLNWSSDLSETFTMAHELGHAGEGLMVGAKAPLFAQDMSMYCVEAPSTCHELLLATSMLEEAKSDRDKLLVLSNIIANTYYHNFVTHLHEGAFQREVYRRAMEGESFTATDFHEIFRQVLTDFWGDDVVLDPGAERTWMRQPHYYDGLYSYTYSASLTISTTALLKIQAEGQSAIDGWLKFLASGSTMAPIDQIRLAGVDVSTDEPLQKTIAYVDSLVDQVADLAEKVLG